MDTYKELPILACESYESWLAWLEAHGETSPAGVWLKFAKKGSDRKTLSYVEAREGALIYGWIDGLLNKIDDDYYAIRFTPRRQKGTWSRINRELVEELITQGKMKPRGLEQVEAAKQDGRWERAYDSSSTATVSPDFQAALDASPKASAFFDTLKASERYVFLYRIQVAPSEKARAMRIQKSIETLEKGETLR